MIKKAVDARPNDGYIVDSLGWAYYRLHRYDEAVGHAGARHRAAPEDSTINDHLGDAYWQVGRKLEATFQWAHARDMKPEADQLPTDPGEAEARAQAARRRDREQDPGRGPPEHAPERQGALPPSVTVGQGESLWDIAVRVYGNADMYQRIYDANRDRIRDPDHIVPGMTLSLPAAGAN